MTDAVVARSAKLGDCCVRDIPRLLSKEEIRDLAQIDSVKFTAAAVLEFGLIAAAVWISETWWNPLIYVLAVIVIGSRINGLGALMHDAAHYNSENDPDWQRNVGLKEYEFPAPPRSMLMRTMQYLSGLKSANAVLGFHKNKETRDIAAAVARARLFFFAALLVSSVVLGFWKLVLLYWIVPLMTVFLAIRYLRSVAEHYAVEHETVLDESRTVLAPFWELWLIAPWGLNYHLEHHMFPGVPCFRLAELHRLLMTRDPYPEMAHITHGYFSGLLRDCASIRPAEAAASL